jgi:hypothetical protein
MHAAGRDAPDRKVNPPALRFDRWDPTRGAVYGGRAALAAPGIALRDPALGFQQRAGEIFGPAPVTLGPEKF